MRTILRRLEQRLRVMKPKAGLTYTGCGTARSLAARAVRQIIDSFCRGSMELVSGMVETRF